MRKIFKYDYNYKMFILIHLVTVVFLILFILTLGSNIIGSLVFALSLLINEINYFVNLKNQGVRLDKDIIKIHDNFGIAIINISDLNYAEVNELKKEKASNLHGLLCEFYHPATYMYQCDYVYNNGRVFNIVFRLKNGNIRKTYFGWMYKEKNKKRVEAKVKELYSFVDLINSDIKKFKQQQILQERALKKQKK